jgi:glycosyltransferase involved in cell wall biosynthesis
MIRGNIRRLINLYKLLWGNNDINKLLAEVASVRDQIEVQRFTLREEADLYLCRLDVPRGLSDELREWRDRTPIPQQPLVSVCVATYNRARLLTERCIPSVLSQTYPNFELIVVGDGCSDETEQLMAKIDDPRLKFVNLPERGNYPTDPLRRWMVAGTQAINHSMSLAQGDYVTHLDDDDEYLPERLEKLVTFAVANKYDLVWHPFWMENPNNEWYVLEAPAFAFSQVTTGSVFYRSWFTRIQWDIEAHRLMEPGDWNRYRRIKYLGPISQRYPEPLMRHYRQGTQMRQSPEGGSAE